MRFRGLLFKGSFFNKICLSVEFKILKQINYIFFETSGIVIARNHVRVLVKKTEVDVGIVNF